MAALHRHTGSHWDLASTQLLDAATLKCGLCRGQARNEVHRMATLLGAALVGHLANLRATLREAEARSREVVQPEQGGRLGGLLHWGRWQRRGVHHEGGGLLCAAPCSCR